MLNDIDLQGYEIYINKLVFEENGIKKIYKEDLDKLKLSPSDKEFILYIITKQKIKLEKKIKKNISENETLEKIKIYKQTNDQKLREEIIIDNLSLVTAITSAYAKQTGIDIQELESYGYEGLALSLDSFELTKGSTFSAFAIKCIKTSIINGIKEIFYGKRGSENLKYYKAIKTIEDKYGITIKENFELIEEVVKLLIEDGVILDYGFDRELARRIIVSITIGNISLNDEKKVNELISKGELIDTHDYAASEVMIEEMRKLLTIALSKLTPIEADIVKELSGFNDGIVKSYDELARKHGCKIHKIVTIYKRALSKLRNSSDISKLARDNIMDLQTEIYGNRKHH